MFVLRVAGCCLLNRIQWYAGQAVPARPRGAAQARGGRGFAAGKRGKGVRAPGPRLEIRRRAWRRHRSQFGRGATQAVRRLRGSRATQGKDGKRSKDIPSRAYRRPGSKKRRVTVRIEAQGHHRVGIVAIEWPDQGQDAASHDDHGDETGVRAAHHFRADHFGSSSRHGSARRVSLISNTVLLKGLGCQRSPRSLLHPHNFHRNHLDSPAIHQLLPASRAKGI